jgi:FkbM family methyltransferase
MMYNVLDEYVGRSLDLYGEFSEAEQDLFRQILKPGMVAFDVGANIGAHALAMARAVSPGGHVVAIEPQRVLYQMMCGNIALSGLTNVVTLMLAAGRQQGRINVPFLDYGRPNNFGGVSMTADLPGEPVSVLPLDALGYPRCDFLKIDVEGMEQEVLEGAVETLGRCRPVLYVENDRRDRAEPLIRFLLGAGYRLYWHLPPLFNPDNFAGHAENVFENIVSVNMLGVPAAAPITLKDFKEITAESAHVDPLGGAREPA